MLDWRRVWIFPPLPPGARVLEIGFGDGAHLREMKSKGWDVGGFDPARPGNPTAEQWTHCDVPRGYYSAIFMHQVLEHLTDPLLVVQAIRRAVTPGGYFVCSTPSTRSLECWLLGKRWDAYDRPDHRHWFNPTSLRLLLWYAGFSRVTVYHQRVVKHVPGPRWFTTLLGCVVAALHLSSRVTVVARP